MVDTTTRFISPEELDSLLKEEGDLDKRIVEVSKALVTLVSSIGNEDDAHTIRNISQSLISSDLLCERLWKIYDEIYTIWQRLQALITRSEFQEHEEASIKQRAAEIISDNLFQLQREVFFKIVNAKEVAEGEKNEDGPALLFPGIEKSKNSIIRSIQSQTEQLKPAAVDICKSFHGIAKAYVETEPRKPGERISFDTISQSYDRESKIIEEISSDISTSAIDSLEFLDNLIDSFKNLKKTYRLKIKSLNDKGPASVTNFDDKLSILNVGCDDVDKRLKPLSVLKNLVKRFPKLEKQLDFFAESQYQAKAVMRFLEEVNHEMGKIFKQYSLESFTVVSFLRFKLNGTSHMYESIYYYYACVQIENDIKEALKKRYAKEDSEKRQEVIDKDYTSTGVGEIVTKLHQHIADMNEANFVIHNGFLEYRDDLNLEKLREILKVQTESIDNSYKKVRAIYKKAQKAFLNFLSQDLGATDLISQFDSYLKDSPAPDQADLIRKAFISLLATKRGHLEELEKRLKVQFGKKIPKEKITALAQLKVRKDFQRELLIEVQEHPRVQEVFLHLIKEFIKIQDDENLEKEDENAIISYVEKELKNEIAQFKLHEAKLFQKILQNLTLSSRDIVVGILAANITMHEIESFSRLLPALPRNELQLDTSYGRLLLDVKSMHRERLLLRGGSAAHLIEKIYEKRERIKLVSNICLFFKECADPFYKRIDTEEYKINHLISLLTRKYQKELNEVIKYWQYLVQEQISPGQGERGKFREYKPDEIQLMSKYISPEQLNTIERQLESSYDLEGESKLFLVERFLMQVVEGLFELFEVDARIREKFENFEKGKKIKNKKFEKEEKQNLLESDSFVPHVKECMKRVNKINRRNSMNDFMKYWEYQIDLKVPTSEKRKKTPVSAVKFKSDNENALHYVSPQQLAQIGRDLELIRTIRDEGAQKNLVKIGMPMIKLAEQCLQLFKEGGQKLVLEQVSKVRREEMARHCDDPDLEANIKVLLSLINQ